MFLHLPTRKVVHLSLNQFDQILLRKDQEAFFTNEGKIIQDVNSLESEHVVLHLKLVGGKGAFGSLLRFIGSQIEKTTNREAMRDLSGRRLHDVNNEQRLQEWTDRQRERERLREEEKEEKLRKLKEQPRHNFSDQKYFDQSTKIRNNLEDAITTALNQGTSDSVVGSSKTTVEATKVGKKLPARGLLSMGLPECDDVDSDDSEGSSEGEQPKAEVTKTCRNEPDRAAVSTTDITPVSPEKSQELPSFVDNEGVECRVDKTESVSVDDSSRAVHEMHEPENSVDAVECVPAQTKARKRKTSGEVENIEKTEEVQSSEKKARLAGLSL